jgi:hypothetical protein
VSKSDIRYEGILCSIDTIESTVALSQGIVFNSRQEREKSNSFIAPDNQPTSSFAIHN